MPEHVCSLMTACYLCSEILVNPCVAKFPYVSGTWIQIRPSLWTSAGMVSFRQAY
jgi:hypothetical protein